MRICGLATCVCYDRQVDGSVCCSRFRMYWISSSNHTKNQKPNPKKIKAKTHADEKRKQKFNETTNARRVYHFISIYVDSGDDAQTHVQLALA